MTLAQLRTRVRAYANDPATGGTFSKTGVNELFHQDLIDAVAADEYKEACNLIRRHAPGFFQKTLVTATSSTQQHTWPSDFIRLLGPMVVNSAGTALTNDETLGTEVSRGSPGIIHGILTANAKQVWVPEQGGFRLYPKVTTSGSKALLLRYEYIPVFPSTASASFTWPDNHSMLLVIKTAGSLRDINGMDTRFFKEKESKLSQDLLIDLKTVDLDTPQFPSSAFDDRYKAAGTMGKTRSSN